MNFGVSLGTAFSRPGHAAICFCVCLFTADYYAIPITLSWIFMAILTSGLLALAIPPVPIDMVQVAAKLDMLDEEILKSDKSIS